ncbi:MAG TPA: hypothetical protein VHL55_05380 [Acidimicrobiia bacterium]|nr:hypothetical protein [Acidimicrobiia bacterium]
MTQEQSTTERAKEEVGRVGEAAKEQVGQVVDEAREQGRALLADATDRLKGEAQHQSQRAAENLRSISTDFRAMAQSTEGSGTAVTWVRMGADQIDGLAERLEVGGFDGLVKDVGGFARRNPTTFLALTFGAGLVAGRLVKNMDMDRITESGRDAGAQHISPSGVSQGSESNVEAEMIGLSPGPQESNR